MQHLKQFKALFSSKFWKQRKIFVLSLAFFIQAKFGSLASLFWHDFLYHLKNFDSLSSNLKLKKYLWYFFAVLQAFEVCNLANLG